MRHSGLDQEAWFQDQDDAGQKVALTYGHSGQLNRQLPDCGLGGRDLLRKSGARRHTPPPHKRRHPAPGRRGDDQYTATPGYHHDTIFIIPGAANRHE